MRALAILVVAGVMFSLPARADHLERASVSWAGSLQVASVPDPAPAGPAAPIVAAGKPIVVTSAMASFYRDGRVTANGERFLPLGFTAAHRSLPFGTKVRVTNTKTGQSIVVRVNDRGPFVAGRSLDLSLGAARAIGLDRDGVGKVTMEVQ